MIFTAIMIFIMMLTVELLYSNLKEEHVRYVIALPGCGLLIGGIMLFRMKTPWDEWGLGLILASLLGMIQWGYVLYRIKCRKSRNHDTGYYEGRNSQHSYTGFAGMVEETLQKLAKSSDNQGIYAIVFECDEDSGWVTFKYANEKMYASWLKKNRGCSESVELRELRYAVEQFEVINYPYMDDDVQHFLDSYVHYKTGEPYTGKGRPIPNIENKYDKKWKNMVEKGIEHVKKNQANLNITEDFVVYMCVK